MNRLQSRAYVAAMKRKSELFDRFADAAIALIPDADIDVGPGEIRIRAPGLAKRLLNDPALRFFPRLSR